MNDTTQSIAALDEEITALQLKRKMIFDSSRAAALEATLGTINQYGFTATELGLTRVSKLKKNAPATKSSQSKAEPKYQDPTTGKTWAGGKGATPLWVKSHLKAGHSIDALLIK